MYEANASKPSSRERNTILINTVVEATEDGGYRLRTEGRAFTDLEEKFEEDRTTDMTSSQPRRVFLANVLSGVFISLD